MKKGTPDFFVLLSIPALLEMYENDYVEALLHVDAQLRNLTLRQYTSQVRQQLITQRNYLAIMLNKQEKKCKYSLIQDERQSTSYRVSKTGKRLEIKNSKTVHH